MAVDSSFVQCSWEGYCLLNISAKKGDGVDDLLETVLLMAEVEEVQANPDKVARTATVE